MECVDLEQTTHACACLSPPPGYPASQITVVAQHILAAPLSLALRKRCGYKDEPFAQLWGEKHYNHLWHRSDCCLPRVRKYADRKKQRMGREYEHNSFSTYRCIKQSCCKWLCGSTMNNWRQISINSVIHQAGPRVKQATTGGDSFTDQWRSCVLQRATSPASCPQYNQHPARAASGKCLKLIPGIAPTRLYFTNSAQMSAIYPSQKKNKNILASWGQATTKW